jgi:hypothetical protein
LECFFKLKIKGVVLGNEKVKDLEYEMIHFKKSPKGSQRVGLGMILRKRHSKSQRGWT